MIGVGTLGLLPGAARDLGAAAGGCGVITQGGFLDRRECVLLRRKLAPSPRGYPQPTHPHLDGDEVLD